MDLEGLGKSPIGRLVPISGHDARWGDFDYFAYVPNPLPRTLTLSDGTVSLVADAASALGRLEMAVSQVPNPALLVRPTLSKEAVSTSAIEGTFAPLEEVLEGDLAGAQAVSAEAREVINYVDAARLAIDLLARRPISVNLLGELQAVLVHDTRGDSFDAGRLRERIVYIGRQDLRIERARYVPPPNGDVLIAGMSEWEKWIHDDESLHLLVRVALGHYQFEALHPFSDGNGRLGRLVMSLQLLEAGRLQYPLLNLAEWLEPRKAEYQDQLFQLSLDGDFDRWVAFMATCIEAQSGVAVERIHALLGARDRILETVRAAGSRGGTAFKIADELIAFPLIDVPWAADRYGITYQSANSAVNSLVRLGVLTEMRRSGRTRKVFYSQEVLRHLSE
jgi:Fic family protein